MSDSLLSRSGASELRLVRLADDRGILHEGWMRLRPARRRERSAEPLQPAPGRYVPVLILGGIGTGRRAVEIVPCPPGFAILALDYPYHGPREPTRGELVAHAREIHRAAHDTPHGVEATLRYLEARRDMDPAGTLVVGASFGVPFVLKGIAQMPRARGGGGRDGGPRGVRAVSLLFGGADLPEIARYRLRERPRWEQEVAAGALSLFFRELEPARHVGAIAPKPLLLINGRDDEFVSGASARALAAAAREPKRQVWLQTKHLQPDAEALLLDLMARTLAWLRQVEAESRGTRPP